ncbi:uncharacterized protein K444DRAFT_233101 [Hyaloscypha bicolor E]|uniref:Uncharacterized protein n=1 Tax=Hyaloscypha bicolor E TaxID=1095630 RepID=A0A2J6SL35_9HELO|nr:uncharacterized protein K444DRAFT_233101 [Hyaloscypha bicolor E]PMD51476.1 hypothetical protein K444DRAFT_233101 [Hyaloscypha bicolor E]
MILVRVGERGWTELVMLSVRSAATSRGTSINPASNFLLSQLPLNVSLLPRGFLPPFFSITPTARIFSRIAFHPLPCRPLPSSRNTNFLLLQASFLLTLLRGEGTTLTQISIPCHKPGNKKMFLGYGVALGEQPFFFFSRSNNAQSEGK